MKILEGDIVTVNLSSGKISREPALPYFERFYGGRGINQYLLFRDVTVGTAPFDPANIIVFGAGVLVGTSAPGAVRLSIDSLNALTGGIGSSSCGGDFAAELRFSGINNLVVKGKSSEPVYLFINDGKLELREAKNLWGKGVKDSENKIKEDLKVEDVQILSIGPAGENLVRCSCIMANAARAAGRCGLGAVMGSKLLKAIAVKGSGTVVPFNHRSFSEKAKQLYKRINKNESQNRLSQGVYCNYPWYTDESPYRNFQGGIIPEETDKILPSEFGKYLTSTKSCYSSRNSSCPIACWGVYEFKDSKGNYVTTEALQGNDPHNFGAKLDLFDPRTVLEGHDLCNDLGLDTDNSCGTIAWAFECYQKGLLGLEQTDGLKLEWGNQEVVFSLLRKMAYRQGFGDILAEGSKRASEILGGSEFSINIKGQDLLESMRASIGWALGTAVSARGGTHTRGAILSPRFENLTSDKLKEIFAISNIGPSNSYHNQEKLVFYFERLETMLDCLGICSFTNAKSAETLLAEDYAELLSLAIDKKVTAHQFLKMGEKIHTLEKCFNVLHRGWTRFHDLPPDRFFEEPIENGPMKGEKLDRNKWNALLDKYYEIHKWDRETGWPCRETLLELGLNEMMIKLAEYNRIRKSK